MYTHLHCILCFSFCENMFSHKLKNVNNLCRFSSFIKHRWEQPVSWNISNFGRFSLSSKMYETSLENESMDGLGHSSFIEKFRCNKIDPADHSINDESLMYVTPQGHYQRFTSTNFNTKGVTLKFQQLCRSFNESCIMIRKPGLELVNYLKSTNFKSPVIRYLLYGKTGCGKSMILHYAVHYCMSAGWLIIPNYHLWDWVRYHERHKPAQREEIMISQYNKLRIDQPVYSVRWLEIFRLMNPTLLDKIYTTKTYKWSKHECSEEGATLRSLVDHGIARPRNSSDVIGCIMREVRTQDGATMPPVLVAADCVNAVFGKTELKMDGRKIEPHELSFIYNLKKLLSNNWKNGAVVSAVNSVGILHYSRRMKDVNGEYPYDMLGYEGFDLFDPHVPVHVPNYTDREVLTQLAYFNDRKWLSGRSSTPAGEAEIIQLCGNNPRDLVNLCGGLY